LGRCCCPFSTRGPSAALEAEPLLLRGRSKTIWQTALRAAPAHAIELTLQNVRLADESDPGDSVVWGPAAHLAAWPRPCVRLLGLNSGRWPRGETDDAILPDHIVPAKELDPDPMPQADRRCFAIIVGGAMSSPRWKSQVRLVDSTTEPLAILRRPQQASRVYPIRRSALLWIPGIGDAGMPVAEPAAGVTKGRFGAPRRSPHPLNSHNQYGTGLPGAGARRTCWHEEIGMSAPSPARVDPGIEPCRGLKVLMSQKLPCQLVGTRIGVEGEFGHNVPKLVGRHFDSEMLSHRLHDRQ
jgi:hypothetical protein